MLNKHLDNKLFLSVVKNTPLISIDLIIMQHGKVLLGKRNNRPAQGYWFVPGGRILKDETIDTAMVRILEKELSLGKLLIESKALVEFRGVYQHFYSDCFAGNVEVSTHYIVLGYCVNIIEDINLDHHDDQHGELKWWGVDTLLRSESVHQYTKDYFLI